jgi:hypothetical protein
MKSERRQNCGGWQEIGGFVTSGVSMWLPCASCLACAPPVNCPLQPRSLLPRVASSIPTGLNNPSARDQPTFGAQPGLAPLLRARRAVHSGVRGAGEQNKLRLARLARQPFLWRMTALVWPARAADERNFTETLYKQLIKQYWGCLGALQCTEAMHSHLQQQPGASSSVRRTASSSYMRMVDVLIRWQQRLASSSPESAVSCHSPTKQPCFLSCAVCLQACTDG